MIAFDTLQVAKDLEIAFTPEQAEALVKVFSRTLSQELVTKDDLKTEVATLKVDMVRWIVGAIAFNLLGTAGLIVTLIKSIPHS